MAQDHAIDLSLHRYKTQNYTQMTAKVSDFFCNICNKSFDRQISLDRHYRTHTGEKLHICTICTKTLSSSNSLKDHIRIHTGNFNNLRSIIENFL